MSPTTVKLAAAINARLHLPRRNRCRRPVRVCPASGWVTTPACVDPAGDHDQRCPVCQSAVSCDHRRPGVAVIPEHQMMPAVVAVTVVDR